MQLEISDSQAKICINSQKNGLNGIEVFGFGLNRRMIFAGFFVFAYYYLGAEVGLALTFQPHPVSVMWPPNSILLAALILNPPRIWWFLFLCALPAHLIAESHSGVPMGMVLCWFISNSFEAFIGAVGIRSLLGSAPRFDRIQNLGVLFLCCALLSPFLSSFLDAAFVMLNGFGHESYWQVWQMRFFSNAFTALTLLPAIVTWGTCRSRPWREIPPGRIIEAAVAFTGLLTVSLIVFCGLNSGATHLSVLIYAPLPFLLWTALRFGVTGTSTAIFFVALLAIWGAAQGRGPFTVDSPEQGARSIQFFFYFAATILMFLAAAIVDHSKTGEQFTKIFCSSADAMIIIRRRDGHLLETNQCWEKMLGRGRNDSIGRTLPDLNIWSDHENYEQLLTATEKGSCEMEACLHTRTGELLHTIISANTHEIVGEDCLVVTIRDISDRKRAERVQQNLAHMSRLAVMGELTAIIAHEINQPLGAILSNADAAEMLLESANPPMDEIRQILTDIRKNDLRADEAIRRIRLLLSKREIQMQALELNKIVSDVLRLVTGDALRRRVRIEKKLGTDLSPVFGDSVHLQQVLLNLVINGMDAMEEVDESARFLIVQTRVHDDGSNEVRVTDCGHGITGDQMSRLFESFFTTKKEGMGLGLSVAQSIIEAHHGKIGAENNSDRGATFHFTVPIVKNTPTIQLLF